MISESVAEPSSDMIRNFEKRTKEHIDRVAKYLRHFYRTTDLGDELLERAKTHDQSKYSNVEKMPYIWLTEYHRCKNNGKKFEYPIGIESKVKEATLHHITTNRHHPEFHDDPSDMNDVDIAEMVADWAAMAEELNEGSPRGWADKNIGTKWKFTEDQVESIYKYIEDIEKSFDHATNKID